MKVNPAGDQDKYRFLGAGPTSFSIKESLNSAIVTPKDFGALLKNGSYKQNLFNAIFELLEKGKEVTVNFGSPTLITNFFAAELADSKTADCFDREYGITVEINKDNEALASSVTFKKVSNSPGYEIHNVNPLSDSPSTDGGLLDADDEKGKRQERYFQTPWESTEANSYNNKSKKKDSSFFEKNYLGTNETADFRRENIANHSGDFTRDRNLNSLLVQIVQYKKIINIPQNNSSNEYDPKGLFIYLNKKTNEIQIILNGKKNIDNESLQSAVIIPIVVHFLKNNFSVLLNYGIQDIMPLNYEVRTSKLFELIDEKYKVEATSNISIKVEEREDEGNLFTFVVLNPD